MPKPRLPNVVATVIGAADKNPGRFRGRNDPMTAPLGEPSPRLKPTEREAWGKFVAERPWLVESDRPMLEIACALRSRVIGRRGMTINVVQVYSAVLSKLGASPADRSKVAMPPQEDEPDEFFPN